MLIGEGKVNAQEGRQRVSEESAPPVFGQPGDDRAWVKCANELAFRIANGRYKPGDLLPQAGAFAREMKTSAPSVQVAYRALWTKGLVDKQYGYYRVQDLTFAAAPSEAAPEPVRARPLREARLLTVGEVAEVLRVSKMTVYRLARDEEIESTRVGRSIRIFEPSLDSYLRNGSA